MLTSISVSGFKSIASIEDLALGPVNVLIGPNGAGKSNFLSVFRMIQRSFEVGGLREFVTKNGGANKILHDGAVVTDAIHFRFSFASSLEINYYIVLSFTNGDNLSVSIESYSYKNNESTPTNIIYMINERPDMLNYQFKNPENLIISFVKDIGIFQFINTASTSKIRVKHSETESLYLYKDGSNIASMLYSLKQHEPRYYRRYVETLRLVWPQLADFVLEPEYGFLLLRWQERGSEQLFDAGQASDGTLRLIALLFVLMQPETKRPKVLILDEPELGLHPAAIRLVAERVGAVADEGTQVLLATQSPLFLDYFTEEQIIVLDREGRATTARRLNKEALSEWRETYSLSQLWDKNLLGGYPH